MEKAVEYVRFHPVRTTNLFPGLIHCYREAFAGAPWYEWKKCLVCDAKFGRNDKVLLHVENPMHCGQAVQDFWPAAQVEKDVTHEVTIEGASSWVAVSDDVVVGFCWGYPITPEKLEEKLQCPGLAATVRAQFPNISRVAYQDDIGVLPELQGRGIAKVLFVKRTEDFRSQALAVGIARTKTQPPSGTYVWYSKKLNYQTIAEYKDTDGRVVMARTLHDLVV